MTNVHNKTQSFFFEQICYFRKLGKQLLHTFTVGVKSLNVSPISELKYPF